MAQDVADTSRIAFTSVADENFTGFQVYPSRHIVVLDDFVYQKMMKFNDALKCYKKAQMIIGNRYHHKLYDARCMASVQACGRGKVTSPVPKRMISAFG